MEYKIGKCKTGKRDEVSKYFKKIDPMWMNFGNSILEGIYEWNHSPKWIVEDNGNIWFIFNTPAKDINREKFSWNFKTLDEFIADKLKSQKLSKKQEELLYKIYGEWEYVAILYRYKSPSFRKLIIPSHINFEGKSIPVIALGYWSHWFDTGKKETKYHTYYKTDKRYKSGKRVDSVSSYESSIYASLYGGAFTCPTKRHKIKRKIFSEVIIPDTIAVIYSSVLTSLTYPKKFQIPPSVLKLYGCWEWEKISSNGHGPFIAKVIKNSKGEKELELI